LPGVFDALGTLLLAAAAIGLPVMFHLITPLAGVAICVLLALLVAYFAAPTLPIVLIFSYLFQNLFVALISPHIEDLASFNSARAYNFILTAVAWAVLAASYWSARTTFDPRFRRIMDVTTVALMLIGAYFVVGLTSDPGNAVTYLRNISAPFFLFQIFALVTYRNRVAMTGALTLVALAALIFGYIELLAQERLFSFVNGDTYINMRIKETYDSGVWVQLMHETGAVLRSYLDTLQIEFLNSPLFADLGIRLNRLVGPNFHSISFAYILAFFSLVLIAIGRWWYAVLALPLLIVIGSKGALVLVLLVVLALAASSYIRGYRLLLLYAALLVAYAAVGIVTGIRVQDYHIIGLIGGLNGFMGNPIGHGIGAGGNLSLDPSAINWAQFQHLGQTDIAVESAIGVLLYQMGVASIFLLGALAWLAVKLWTLRVRTGDRLAAVAALALLAILVNGIFQEEALFAPLALGMITALAGLHLGRAYRAGPGSALVPARTRRTATP
jgi:hypothetical protein